MNITKREKSFCFSIAFNPVYKFIKMYIIRLGFLDGVEGFIISLCKCHVFHGKIF